MEDFRLQPRYQTQTQAQIDQGLRSYMLKVYNYMTIGLVVTGVVAFLAFKFSVTPDGGSLTEFGRLMYQSSFRWVVIFAPFVMVMVLSYQINRMSVSAAQLSFWIYAALMGLSLGVLGLVYTRSSIAQVFFITAASFGALSLYGYTTKRDLSGWGSFLFMGLIGIILASLVNLYFQNSTTSLVISVIGVLVFTGLTAYDTQKIKELYIETETEDVISRKAVTGALTLYLDFINLFLMLMRIFGNSRN